MNKVSVIVPIYNSQVYLDKCIESILNQTYKNIELILVDDGSKDGSEKICRLFLKDSRVKYIKKENGGVSSARNRGIKESKGDYIVFVDSDDYIETNMVEKLMDNVDDNQLVICGLKTIYINKIFFHNSKDRKRLDKFEIINILFKDDNIGGYLCNKIYDAKIIKENKLLLDESIHMCEDLLFNVQYVLTIDSGCIIENNLYNYRMRKSSATWSLDSTKIANLSLCFKHIEKLLIENNLLNDAYKYYKLILLYKYLTKEIKKDTKKEYTSVMCSKNIGFKKKVKLHILRNFNLIYRIYMKNKTHRYYLFD